jgi:hypothetical protein
LNELDKVVRKMDSEGEKELRETTLHPPED